MARWRLKAVLLLRRPLLQDRTARWCLCGGDVEMAMLRLVAGFAHAPYMLTVLFAKIYYRKSHKVRKARSTIESQVVSRKKLTNHNRLFFSHLIMTGQFLAAYDLQFYCRPSLRARVVLRPGVGQSFEGASRTRQDRTCRSPCIFLRGVSVGYVYLLF